jgi:hypothetical protein
MAGVDCAECSTLIDDARQDAFLSKFPAMMRSRRRDDAHYKACCACPDSSGSAPNINPDHHLHAFCRSCATGCNFSTIDDGSMAFAGTSVTGADGLDTDSTLNVFSLSRTNQHPEPRPANSGSPRETVTTVTTGPEGTSTVTTGPQGTSTTVTQSLADSDDGDDSTIGTVIGVLVSLFLVGIICFCGCICMFADSSGTGGPPPSQPIRPAPTPIPGSTQAVENYAGV